CLVEEYGNFTIPGPPNEIIHLDGQNTLPENIADNGGIKMAYEAWSARYKSDPTSLRYNNKKLPGFEKLTPEQMFFVEYGHIWCTKETPESYQDTLQDVHSPGKWRINGVVRNSEFFAQAFKCKPGSPMNPVSKCSVL
ncbi:Viral polyprotein, partial [Mortierella sp. AD094]